jgi:hypothetical protein
MHTIHSSFFEKRNQSQIIHKERKKERKSRETNADLIEELAETENIWAVDVLVLTHPRHFQQFLPK